MQGALIAITYAQIGSGSSQGTPDSRCADPAESLNCTLPICLLMSSFQRGRFISGVLMVAIFACLGLSAQSQSQAAAPAHLTIDPGEIVTQVSPTLYGMMTEEINHSYDGGLYAELVQNRTFRAS